VTVESLARAACPLDVPSARQPSKEQHHKITASPPGVTGVLDAKAVSAHPRFRIHATTT
jgi:hypothetical protein